MHGLVPGNGVHLGAGAARDVHDVHAAVDVLQLPAAQALCVLGPLILAPPHEGLKQLAACSS
jgi:hypothetical protein